MGTSFRYDRTFDFDATRDVLWDALTDTDQYQHWWPWLRSFETNGATQVGLGQAGLAPGAVARCSVRAPLPYTLTFAVHVERIEPMSAIDTHVTGDLTGPARLEVAGAGATSTARLTWAVELQMPMLSAASLVARPVLVWAHDRVVSTGVDQFRRQALSRPRDLD